MSKYMLDQHESGLFVRRGIPADPYVIGEVPTYSAFHVGPGDRVLDLGANIGAMSHRFLTDGADYVVAVEPFPDNVEMVRTNLRSFDKKRYRVIEAAVVGPTTGSTLELNTPDTNFGMVSRVKHDVPYAVITGTLTVPTVQFDDLLNTYQPTAIKCDIEGGELDFLDALADLPDTVTRLAIEWHNFSQYLETGKMAEGYVSTDARLRQSSGFTLLSHSGAFLPSEHSALLCVYAR